MLSFGLYSGKVSEGESQSRSCQAPFVHVTPLCFPAFPLCSIWVDLGLSHLFLSSRPFFPFLSLSLSFCHISLCFTPCPTNFVAAFCWKHSTEAFFSLTSAYFPSQYLKFPLISYLPFPIKTHFLSSPCRRKQLNMQFNSMHD